MYECKAFPLVATFDLQHTHNLIHAQMHTQIHTFRWEAKVGGDHMVSIRGQQVNQLETEHKVAADFAKMVFMFSVLMFVFDI